MLDRLGVTYYAVNVTPVSGRALDDLKDRVRVMNREIRHLVMATTRIENSINNSRSLTDGVMDFAQLDAKHSHELLLHPVSAGSKSRPSGFK